MRLYKGIMYRIVKENGRKFIESKPVTSDAKTKVKAIKEMNQLARKYKMRVLTSSVKQTGQKSKEYFSTFKKDRLSTGWEWLP